LVRVYHGVLRRRDALLFILLILSHP
jgi:hypothetical protein